MVPENLYLQGEIQLPSYFVRCDQLQWKVRLLRIRQGRDSWGGYLCGHRPLCLCPAAGVVRLSK